MASVTFSKRLYGLPGMLIFLTLTVSFGVTVLQHVQAAGSPQGLTLMLGGMTLYLALGTIGWRYSLRRHSLAWTRAYFAAQTILFFGLFWLENADTHSGA